MYKKVAMKFYLLLLLLIISIIIFAIFKFEIFDTNAYTSNEKFELSTGVNIHFVKPNIEEVNKIEKAGFKVVRMDLAWHYIEKKKGLYDFLPYDKLVESMSKRHIKILFILDYANPLYDKGLSPYSDEGRKAFVNFARQAVHHYKGNQIIWEIWNEPNKGFWKPKPDAYSYSMLVIDSSNAIREEDKNAFIIAPALAYFDYSYLNSIGKNGVFQYINAISIHPYRQKNPETVISDYKALRILIDKYPHNKNIQIFSGEWGYPTSLKSMNNTKQAQYCVREYLTNIMSGVNLSIWYDWKDDGTDNNNPEDNFGVMYNNLNPKPAYYAIKTMNMILNGYVYIRRENIRSNDDYVLRFEKGNKVVYALWTINRNHNVIIDLKDNDAKIVELTGKSYKKEVINRKCNVEIDNSVKYILN